MWGKDPMKAADITQSEPRQGTQTVSPETHSFPERKMLQLNEAINASLFLDTPANCCVNSPGT